MPREMRRYDGRTDWELDYHTWEGHTPCAYHYYGHLDAPWPHERSVSGPGTVAGVDHRLRVELECRLTADEAKRLNKDRRARIGDYRYKPGHRSTAHHSKERLIESAVREFEKLAKPGEQLLMRTDPMVQDEDEWHLYEVIATKEG